MLTQNKVLDNLVQNGCIKGYSFNVLAEQKYDGDEGYLVLEFHNGQKLKISPDFHVPNGCLDWSYKNVKVETPKDSVEPTKEAFQLNMPDSFKKEFDRIIYGRKPEFPESP